MCAGGNHLEPLARYWNSEKARDQIYPCILQVSRFRATVFGLLYRGYHVGAADVFIDMNRDCLTPGWSTVKHKKAEQRTVHGCPTFDTQKC